MHVLMIAPEQIPVPPINGGSVEICMNAIANRLAQQHLVTLISRRHSRYPNRTTKGNLTIIRVPSGGTGHYLTSVAQAIKGKHYDWIQIDNRPSFISKIRADFPNTPISVFLHSLTFVSKSRYANGSVENSLAKANLIVANSSSLENELVVRFPKLKSKITHVLLGVDLQQFKPPSPQQRMKLRNRYGLRGSFVFSFAGRIIPRKGIPLLLKALSKVRKSVPNVKLIIAGKGNSGYVSRLKSLSKRLHVSTKFIGQLPHRRMHEAYWPADCFVCPSQSHEAFGLVNVEAMATGIPAVSSNNGGIKEIVRNEINSLLVKNYRNPDAFAAQLLRLARNRSYAQALGRQARRDMIQKFNWNQTTSRLIKLYGK